MVVEKNPRDTFRHRETKICQQPAAQPSAGRASIEANEISHTTFMGSFQGQGRAPRPRDEEPLTGDREETHRSTPNPGGDKTPKWMGKMYKGNYPKYPKMTWWNIFLFIQMEDTCQRWWFRVKVSCKTQVGKIGMTLRAKMFCKIVQHHTSIINSLISD